MGYKSRETTAKTSDSQEAEGEGGRGEDAFVGIAKGAPWFLPAWSVKSVQPHPCSAVETRCFQLAHSTA